MAKSQRHWSQCAGTLTSLLIGQFWHDFIGFVSRKINFCKTIFSDPMGLSCQFMCIVQVYLTADVSPKGTWEQSHDILNITDPSYNPQFGHACIWVKRDQPIIYEFLPIQESTGEYATRREGSANADLCFPRR